MLKPEQGGYGSFARLLLIYWRPALVLLCAGLCLALIESLGAGLVLLLLGGAGGSLLSRISAWLPVELATPSLAARLQLGAVLLIVFILARGVLMYIQHTMVYRLRVDAERSLQRQIHQQLHAVRLDYLLRRPSG